MKEKTSLQEVLEAESLARFYRQAYEQQNYDEFTDKAESVFVGKVNGIMENSRKLFVHYVESGKAFILKAKLLEIDQQKTLATNDAFLKARKSLLVLKQKKKSVRLQAKMERRSKKKTLMQ
jgi:hypothetical protein